jgi:hypothetical protein
VLYGQNQAIGRAHGHGDGKPSAALPGGYGRLFLVNAVLAALVGGLLAIAGGLVGIALSDRRERSRWLRDTQLQASINLLSALQLLIRRMINLAYLDPKDHASPTAAAFGEATVAWNNALYGALLIVPPRVAAEIPLLDREVDRLYDLAVARTWTPAEFRQERAKLGRMAADFLRLSRNLAGLADIDLPSIWTWDDSRNQVPIQVMTAGDDMSEPPA